jgi:uncharacterized membrane protein YjjB (DUF3815 family)
MDETAPFKPESEPPCDFAPFTPRYVPSTCLGSASDKRYSLAVMPELAKDTVALLSFLLPGFLVAWVFYALTSHQRPAQAERIIQALIFTLFVKAAVILEQVALEFVGKWYAVALWNTNSELLASLASALVLGFAAAYVSNKDSFHAFLRDKGISKRSADPSEWCGVLSKYPRYVVLNLKDERRLYGWPEVWPSDPEKGHFFLVLASWLEETKTVELPTTEGILVDVRDVKFIEFVEAPKGTP